jgi:V/A-type H+-transporting ATPase subunit E
VCEKWWFSLTNISHGLSSIAKEILEDAQKEAEAILLKAGSEGRGILDEAKAEAERRYNLILKKSKEDLETKQREINDSLSVEARNALLKAREDMLEEVFKRTQDHLKDYASSKNYLGCLSELISEASKRIGSDRLIVKLNKRDHRLLSEKQLDAVSRKLQVKLVKSDEFIDCVGGVMVSSFDGKVIVNNTFESRLEMLKRILRANIAKMLFEEESKSQQKGS